MNDRARRTRVNVAFGGVDITDTLERYLTSLTYTDSEEDESDDLKITVQDRDGVWLTSWIALMVDAAASPSESASKDSASSSASSSGAAYKVTAQSGLNIRAGADTTYSKLGAFSYGATVEVESISGGWAKITYSGKTAYVSANYLEAVSGSDSSGGADDTSVGTVYGSSGHLIIRAEIVSEGDTSTGTLSCGEFTLDSVSAESDNEITFKAAALPADSSARNTKTSKTWENCKLSSIAKEMASNAGMGCIFDSTVDPEYTEVEQYKQSDVSFLADLCKCAGLSFKVSENSFVIFSQSEYELKQTARTIKHGDKSYTGYTLDIGEDAEYTSCRVRYTDPTGKTIEAIAYTDDYKEGSLKNQQLELVVKVASVAEAQNYAEKQLRLHNKFVKTAKFTVPGDVTAAAGVAYALEGFGAWDGVYIASKVKHTVKKGYTTTLELRRALAI